MSYTAPEPPVEVVLETVKYGVEVAMVIDPPPTVFVLLTAAGDAVDVVAAETVSAASAAPEYAVREVPRPSQPIRMPVMYRSFAELFKTELDVALAPGEANDTTTAEYLAVETVVPAGDAEAVSRGLCQTVYPTRSPTPTARRHDAP